MVQLLPSMNLTLGQIPAALQRPTPFILYFITVAPKDSPFLLTTTPRVILSFDTLYRRGSERDGRAPEVAAEKCRARCASHAGQIPVWSKLCINLWVQNHNQSTLGKILLGVRGNVILVYLSLTKWSCLENPRDRGAWWAAIYGVAQSRTRLMRLSSSSSSKWCVCWATGRRLVWLQLG